MNRIVLIGNGFDLAHGLPTSYKNFLDDYWNQFFDKMYDNYKKCGEEEYEDDLIRVQFNQTGRIVILSIEDSYALPTLGTALEKRVNDYKDAYKETNNQVLSKGISIKFKNRFFKRINSVLGLQKWVDIENEYYVVLKNIYLKEIKQSPDELNEEFRCIENQLMKYLSEIQEKQISARLIKKEIWDKIIEPLRRDDISINGRNVFDQFLEKRLEDAQDEAKVRGLLHKYGCETLSERGNVEHYRELIEAYGVNRLKRLFALDPHAYFFWPEDILFLNFNYTNTASLYISSKNRFKENHIHGELNNPENPIIFGYGDEMDESYKKIVELNNNKYLENIKSICYLKTDNYRNLLSFIDSAPYQIIILGHSCGNSDRTMLNTLFEHPNCLSIKPYYYLKDDGSDNYIDIVQNISRDFSDPKLMRDRVVNQTYCKPLVEGS